MSKIIRTEPGAILSKAVEYHGFVYLPGITARDTKQDIKIGICAACHPFFTGEQKFVDTAGRVEKFARRYGGTKATRASAPRKA